MVKDYSDLISKELGITKEQIRNTLNLLDEGATIPFISRYRKEVTGSLDEVVITNIRDKVAQLRELDKRRLAIIESIDKQEKLTDELLTQLNEAKTLVELEDIYLPYKPKRKTRASIAREKGLEPLAKIMMSQKHSDIEEKASEFINEEKEVNSVEDALAGARDIIAEWINEHKYCRERIRKLFERESIIRSKVIKGKEEEGEKFKNYFEWEECLSKAPSHRILAMFRGENESMLKIHIIGVEQKALEILDNIFIKSDNDSSDHVELAITDCYKRLLAPSMETELRNLLKERADKDAIGVFAENLRQLLLGAPMGQKNILAIDPGFRSGCKLVCLDRQGNLLHNENIYPHAPQREAGMAIKKIVSLVNAYNIEAIAIGNGTAGRETENMIRRIKFDRKLIAIMVNESGASVYSASKIARDEFPEYDVTVRGAVSIGRRLMDPLAELVKIDPKSIGVGQYQHDVNQSALNKGLDDVVVSCVNSVGVEVNTASKELLSYVSGFGSVLAAKFVDYRKENGPFNSRKELTKVPRFGDKSFQQAAGFLRIQNSENPLDKSAVHPESYNVVNKMATDMNTDIEGLMKNEELRKKIDLKKYITPEIGIPTLNDIMAELAKPGRDPRKKFDLFEFAKGVNSINDLQEGMVLPGIVTNITAFGAFVDIGVHQDGLVHISMLANKFVKNPNDIVKLNQKVEVKVVGVDVDRKRIQLSMKDVE
ncbi:MAG: RNA-binding transcriptional accessory protein [Bacteroidales bacterium]|nr:RNA-binding transcriptional accessory protein [Bacteroidales bacterium]